MTESGRIGVAVVGSYGVGLWITAPHLPAAGETVLGRNFAFGHGGKGSNQAVGVARLGAKCSLLARVGDDRFGQDAHALWADEGVDASHVITDRDAPTMAGFILLDDEGENRIVTDPGANAQLTPADVEAFAGRIAESAIMLVQMEIPPETVAAALSIARRHGVRSILNPAPASLMPQDVLANANIVTPNQSEARMLLGLPANDPATDEEIAEKLQKTGIEAVVMTRGAEGAVVFSQAQSFHVPGISVPVHDTTGAGDGFNAALAFSLSKGSALVAAVRFAVAAGAHVVTRTKVVPALPVMDEVQSLLKKADAAP